MTLSTAATRRLAALELLAVEKPFLEVTLPFRLESRANDHRSNHWGGRSKTSKAQRMGAQLALTSHKTSLRRVLRLRGLVVRVVRIGPRELDSHDNIGMSCKAITDGAADALGVNDRNASVTFVPDGEVGPWGARIEFYEGES